MCNRRRDARVLKILVSLAIKLIKNFNNQIKQLKIFFKIKRIFFAKEK